MKEIDALGAIDGELFVINEAIVKARKCIDDAVVYLGKISEYSSIIRAKLAKAETPTEEKPEPKEKAEIEPRACVVCGMVFTPKQNASAKTCGECCRKAWGAYQMMSKKNPDLDKTEYLVHWFKSHELAIPAELCKFKGGEVADNVPLSKPKTEPCKADGKKPEKKDKHKEVRKCVVCGEEFVPVHPKAMTCGETCKAAWRDWVIARNHKTNKSEVQFLYDWFNRRCRIVPERIVTMYSGSDLVEKKESEVKAYDPLEQAKKIQQEREEWAKDEDHKDAVKKEFSSYLESLHKPKDEGEDEPPKSGKFKKPIEINSPEFKARLAKIAPAVVPGVQRPAKVNEVERTCIKCGRIELVLVPSYLSQPDFCDDCTKEMSFSERKRFLDRYEEQRPKEIENRRKNYHAVIQMETLKARQINAGVKPIAPSPKENKSEPSAEKSSSSESKDDSDRCGDRKVGKSKKPKSDGNSPFYDKRFDALLPQHRIECLVCGKKMPCFKSWFDKSEVICPSCYSGMSEEKIMDFHEKHKTDIATRKSNRGIEKKEFGAKKERKPFVPTISSVSINKSVEDALGMTDSRIMGCSEEELKNALRRGRLSQARYRIEMKRRKNLSYFNCLPEATVYERPKMGRK